MSFHLKKHITDQRRDLFLAKDECKKLLMPKAKGMPGTTADSEERGR